MATCRSGEHSDGVSTISRIAHDPQERFLPPTRTRKRWSTTLPTVGRRVGDPLHVGETLLQTRPPERVSQTTPHASSHATQVPHHTPQARHTGAPHRRSSCVLRRGAIGHQKILSMDSLTIRCTPSIWTKEPHLPLCNTQGDDRSAELAYLPMAVAIWPSVDESFAQFSERRSVLNHHGQQILQYLPSWRRLRNAAIERRPLPVLHSSDRFEVRRVDTVRYLAQVVELQTIRDIAHQQLIHHSMDRSFLTLPVSECVSPLANCAHPQPTAGSFTNPDATVETNWQIFKTEPHNSSVATIDLVIQLHLQFVRDLPHGGTT
jgi:hypothetical protein